MKKGFSLIEILLVLAILSTLMFIIVISLKPAETLSRVSSVQKVSNVKDLERALKAYVLDNAGNLPNSFDSLTTGYYDICNPGQVGACIDFSAQVVPKYIPNVPKDLSYSTTVLSGYRIKYDASTDAFSIVTMVDYLATRSDWGNISYYYKIPLVISNETGSTLSNYQVLFVLDTQALISSSKLNSDCSDLRIQDTLNSSLGYWVEDGCNTTSTLVWVKVPSIPIAGSTLNLFYSNPSATSASSIENTFIPASITHFMGNCSDATNCGYLDNHSEADSIRGAFPVITTSVVSTVNDSTGGDYFYKRFRYLFKPDVTGTYYFGVNSDDGSEVGIFPGDGYGTGYNTGHPFGAHTMLANWYGGHGVGTCGSIGTMGNTALTAGRGYWMDYIMEEWAGGNLAQTCIMKPGGSYRVVSTSNFSGQIFTRQYVSGTEPSISIGAEQSLL